MSDRDETPREPAGDQPPREQDPGKLLPDPTIPDPTRQLGEGAGSDPSRHLAAGAEHDAGRLIAARSEEPDQLEHEHKYPPHHPAHHWKHTARWLVALLTLVGVYAAGMAIHDRAQERDYHADLAHRMTGGDPSQGPALIRSYGCAQCHTIPGVDGANGLVGPPLAGIANRVYIGGVLTNTPDHMVRWIMNPKAVDAKTAMPYLGVTEDQARHIAAYLYTLR